MLSFVRPQYCLPLHGEYRNLMEFRVLAREMGVPEDHVVMTEIGDVVEFRETGAVKSDPIPAGAVLVDGLTLGVTHAVLRDRHRLANEGVLVVTLAIDGESGEIVAGPDFIARGVFDEGGAEDDLLAEARHRILRALARLHGQPEHSVMVARIREVLEGYLNHHLRRMPMILPVITEV
jgi:ribonuclease J